MASGGRDKLIKVWDLSKNGSRGRTGTTGEENFLYDLRGHMNSIDCLDQFTSGNHIVSASLDATLMIWDLSKRKYTHILQGHTCMVTCVKVLSDQLLASGSLDKTIKIWKIDLEITSKNKNVCLRTLMGHAWPILSLEFSKANGLLFSGSSDNTIRMWDIGSGQCVKILSGHEDDVFCLKLISNTGQVISSSFDGCVKVWDLNTGECKRTLKTHIPVYKFVFSSFVF